MFFSKHIEVNPYSVLTFNPLSTEKIPTVMQVVRMVAVSKKHWMTDKSARGRRFKDFPLQ